ncbi:stemmadenine O-acetyltransferase [Ricinus communis]|nr:stemmadenine O-acetyltransferase [Ricinus communis]
MEIDILSKGCIKPSVPTPSDLRTYKISLLDQFMPLVYTPMILFYSNQDINPVKDDDDDDIISKRLLLLQQSLSQTLTRFHPLAGKIKDDFSIDCSDEGAFFVAARTKIALSDYLQQPDLNSLYKLLPSTDEPTSGSYVSMIQETIFACGGIAIGVYVLHTVMDGSGLASFLKAWAAIACDEQSTKACYPNFDGTSMFPQYGAFPRDANVMAYGSHFRKRGKITRRRFVFDGPAIANLMEKARAETGVPENPTRVEVVSALLIKHMMAIFKAKSGVDKPLAINHAVNMRRRMVPPIPECSVGNFVWPAATICKPNETQLSSLVYQLKEAIMKINSDFVRNIKGGDHGGFIKLYELKKEAASSFTSPLFSNGVDYVLFSSWCNFGLYQVDFGWGKPVWTTTARYSNGDLEIPFLNSIVLMDARKNKGIEAWMVLDEDIMVMLDKDKNFIQYASPNPSPLN